MAGMNESCSVCGRDFEVQFRYQMEERDGGFAFFCSHECHQKVVSGEVDGGVTCDACRKRFSVELVSQVVRIKGERKYACSPPCRDQVLAEGEGSRLGSFMAPPSAAAPAPQPSVVAPPPSPLAPPRAPVAPRPGAAPTSVFAPGVPTHPYVEGGTAPAVAPATPPPPSAAVPKARLHAPRRLAIFNHKGGTGKTTTSVSIAAGLAARGLRVLLVDTDSQGNVGVSLDAKTERSLYHVLVMGLRPKDAAVEIRPNLDLIVSNETLAAAELYLAGRQNRDRVLKDRIGAGADSYDVILLDCSPSLSLMNQNALVFADGILVPVACDFLSLVGVRQVIKTVKNVNSLLHHPVQIFGVLPTFYDARARICRDAVDTLRQHFGDRCLPPIRANVKIKEAPAQGSTIYEYAPESNAASDYKRIVDFLVDGPSALSRAPAATEDENDEPTAAAG